MVPVQLFLPLLAALPTAPAAQDGEERSHVVYAERVYPSPGTVIEDGVVHVSDGKITAVEHGRPAPEDEDVLKAAAITAGMIDPSARIHTGMHSVEQSEEVQPHLRVAHALDLFDHRWERQLRSGVTTVLATPDDENVVGGLCVVLKTGGEPSIEARTVKEDAALRGAIGSEPSRRNRPAWGGGPTDFYIRRPTTRMGVEWAWRKAFYDAAASKDDPERAFPGSDVLLQVLAGEMPLYIQAWTTQDIRTAVYLKEEMQREGLGEIDLVIDAAAEAWKEPHMLVRTETPVVLPPFPRDGRVGPENAFMAWNVADLLLEEGVVIALSSHGAASVADRLGMQAGYAMRGGLTFDEALAAVTLAPARILGVEDRVGSIDQGKDADLVLWSGKPFEPTSRVVGVLIEGAVAVDPRKP